MWKGMANKVTKRYNIVGGAYSTRLGTSPAFFVVSLVTKNLSYSTEPLRRHPETT